jgi:hypothetical protein
MAVVAEVLANREALVQRRRLEDDAKQAPDVRPVRPHVGAEDADTARGRTHERGDDSEQRRFSAAVRPEQREHFSRADRKAHVFQGDAIPVRVADVCDIERRA